MQKAEKYRPIISDKLCSDLVNRLSNLDDLSSEEQNFLDRLEDRLDTLEVMRLISERKKATAAKILQDQIDRTN